MFINPKPIPMADSPAEIFVIREDRHLRELDGTVLAGSYVVVKNSNDISISGSIRGNSSGVVSDINAKISVESLSDLYNPRFVERHKPCRPVRIKKASVRYVDGQMVFKIKRETFIPSLCVILIGRAYIGVTDGRWYAHGFAITPDFKDGRVVCDTISEAEAKYALGDAGYTDITEPEHRNPANYPRPRPRTAPRQRCPKNTGQASLLGSMGVSDD
ncbi:MAG: hypothetical protein AB7E51_02530 [Pseudodesulfovibrio sp.]|uniref:hypothetical protein n=1 Tax=Pseudodesulfovibrio sp. TaxID=2035812 RepID=UPI003D0F877C